MKTNSKARWPLLAFWFGLNMIVFVLCYLNYRLQLKHRYLFKTLSVGLCISRAAAMVINFNLLLVWLPMCKYTLTSLAYKANLQVKSLRSSQKQKQTQTQNANANANSTLNGKLSRLFSIWIKVKLLTLKSFVIGVDHCTLMHTICASTITIASVVHSIAHLMNAINFSQNFDPFLSNLNIFEHKHQNPLYFFTSVPGITGVSMLLILALMSLSSVEIIRNSSFDLFHILHRLSVVFVILLIMHPVSHVLKEQANVDRHDPELCDRRLMEYSDFNTSTIRAENSTATQSGTDSITTTKKSPCLDDRPSFVAQSSVCWYVLSVGLSCYLFDLIMRRIRRNKSSIELLAARLDLEGNLIELTMSNNHRRFARWLPGQFVYLNCPQIARHEWHPFTISSMDESTRKFTLHIKTGGDWTTKLRHKLQLLQLSPEAAGLDCFDPFNSKTSSLSLFEQRKCKFEPQIECTRVTKLGDHDDGINNPNCMAAPTTSNFVLIDLAPNQVPVSQFVSNTSLVPISSNSTTTTTNTHDVNSSPSVVERLSLFIDGPFHSPFERLLEQQVSVCIANGVGWTAFSSIFQCLGVSIDASLTKGISQAQSLSSMAEFVSNLELGPNDKMATDGERNWWSSWNNFALGGKQLDIATSKIGLDQSDSMNKNHSNIYQISNCCQANNIGCGQTTGEIVLSHNATGHPIQSPNPKASSSANPCASASAIASAKLHLMVIVTSIEQLRPFYVMAINYFHQLRNYIALNDHDKSSPSSGHQVKEIRAYLTRVTQWNEELEQFCIMENLNYSTDHNEIRVNDEFCIYFGKPAFDQYLERIKFIYPDIPKISVYCCGSYPVKKIVQEACKSINKMNRKAKSVQCFSYHEENF